MSEVDGAFAARLRRARIAAALTQEQLAERAGISVTGIAALEAGRRRTPRATTVKLLLDALGVEGDERLAMVAAAAGAHRLGSIRSRVETRPPIELTAPPLSGDAERALVGRSAEMAELGDALGSGIRVVIIAGEAGIGKSRLAEELTVAHEATGRVLWGRCTPHRLGSYEPFIAPIRDALAVLGDTAPGGQLARLIPELGLGGAGLSTSADPEVERRLLFEAVATVLHRLGPTILVLDDIQWADAGALALLCHLATHPRLAELTLLVTARTTDLNPSTAATLADLRRRTSVRRLDLGGLDPTAVALLVHAVVGDQPPPSLIEAVSVAAGGNPLFVRELTEHLVAHGYGTGSGGAVTPELVPVPRGIRETLIERLAGVGEAGQRLVRTGAVLGRSFDPDLAAEVEGLADDQVLAAVEDALVSGLVVEVSACELSFSHGLVQSAVHDSLSARRRLETHRRAAVALERRSDGGTAATFTIAHHWAAVAAEDRSAATAAATWAKRAGDAASAAADADQAIAYYERAAGLWGEATVERVETLLSLGAVLSSLSRRGEADAAFRSALEIADEVGAASHFARAAIGLASTVEYGVADIERVDVLEEALRRLDPGDEVVRTMTAAMLKRQLGFDLTDAAYRRRQEAAAIVLDAVSRPELSRELLLTLGTARDAIMVDDPTVLARLSRATIAVGAAERRLHVVAHGWYGAAWAALELADGPMWHQAVEAFTAVAAELDLPFEQALARTMAATTALIEGRYGDVERLASKAHAIGSGADPNADTILLTATVIAGVDRGHGPAMVEAMRAERVRLASVPTFMAGFAGTAALSGDLPLARELLDEHLRAGLDAVRRDLEWLPVMGFLASVAARVGAADAAAALYSLLDAHPASAIRVGPIAGWWGPSDHHLAGLCRVMGRTEEAELRLRRALRTCETLGARPWLARTQWALADLIDHTGGSTGEVADLRAQAVAIAAELEAAGLLG